MTVAPFFRPVQRLFRSRINLVSWTTHQRAAQAATMTWMYFSVCARPIFKFYSLCTRGCTSLPPSPLNARFLRLAIDEHVNQQQKKTSRQRWRDSMRQSRPQCHKQRPARPGSSRPFWSIPLIAVADSSGANADGGRSADLGRTEGGATSHCHRVGPRQRDDVDARQEALRLLGRAPRTELFKGTDQWTRTYGPGRKGAQLTRG